MEYTLVLAYILQFILVIVIFGLIVFVSKYVINKVNSMPSFTNSRFANPLEYFPVEELSTLKQVYYLIMAFMFIVISLYLIFNWNESARPIFVLDIIISTYLFIKRDVNSNKDYIILFLLIPFGSISNLLGDNVLFFYDIFHIIGYLYYIQVYYRKFVKYTESNGLGITIILLFSIVIVSFLFTMLVEGVSPLDSIAMVSNAFTSNSFDPAGKSGVGKLDSLVLAWGGFILSGVGTATLSASIIRGYVDRQFDNLEELIKNKKKEK